MLIKKAETFFNLWALIVIICTFIMIGWMLFKVSTTDIPQLPKTYEMEIQEFMKGR